MRSCKALLGVLGGGGGIAGGGDSVLLCGACGAARHRTMPPY
jgi:hypothetical protein